MKTRNRRLYLFLLLACMGLAFVFREPLSHLLAPAIRSSGLTKVGRYIPDAVVQRASGMKTVSDRMAQYGPSARSRFVDLFEKAKVSYPPRGLVLVGLKQERGLEVYAKGSDDQWRFIRSYPIKAASGQLGPKLREGDCQVPEGFYAIESLNPNSSFHLALRVGYPNATDKAMAKADGRLKPGSDIMIHGDGGSIGCISISDEAIEEIFVMSAETGCTGS